MEREHLYRGLNKKDGWIVGNLILSTSDNPIIVKIGNRTVDGVKFWTINTPAYRVESNSIGEFTGLTARSYKKNLDSRIFEDDIFRATKETDEGDITYYLVVMWIKQLAAFYLVPVEHYYVIRDNDVSNEPEFAWLFDEASLFDFSLDSQLMKVGNIHDNPEYFEL